MGSMGMPAGFNFELREGSLFQTVFSPSSPLPLAAAAAAAAALISAVLQQRVTAATPQPPPFLLRAAPAAAVSLPPCPTSACGPS